MASASPLTGTTAFSIPREGTLLPPPVARCPASGCTDGSVSIAGLIQDTNGTFYGTTAEGGTSNEGAVYSLSMGLGPFVKTQTTSGAVGTSVVILGTNLTGATTLLSTAWRQRSPWFRVSEITATVPAGATSGRVQVTTPTVVLLSNQNFRVTP